MWMIVLLQRLSTNVFYYRWGGGIPVRIFGGMGVAHATQSPYQWRTAD